MPPPPPSPPPPLPPSPSSPPPNNTKEDKPISTCEVFCIGSIETGLEWYILFGGLAATIFVLLFAAYSKVRIKLETSAVLSVLLAAGDGFTDIAFTIQRLGITHTTAEQAVAALLLTFLLLPTAVSLSQVLVALRSPDLDVERLQECAAFYALILFVALSNMELLRVLPWRKGMALHDGLPDRRLMLRVWLAVTLLEDMPQLTIQIVILVMGGSRSLLGPLSICFSVSAIMWRGLRKAIYVMPSNLAPIVTSTSTSALRRPPTCSLEEELRRLEARATCYHDAEIAVVPGGGSATLIVAETPAPSHATRTTRTRSQAETARRKPTEPPLFVRYACSF